jgi:hypothetical protein
MDLKTQDPGTSFQFTFVPWYLAERECSCHKLTLTSNGLSRLKMLPNPCHILEVVPATVLPLHDHCYCPAKAMAKTYAS